MTASSTSKRAAAQPADALPAALRADFANPGAEFRGAPFWAWNGELDPETCRQQIDLLHDAGIGGFFMHSRVGLRTPYLSDRWFECVGACVDEAKKLKMRAWLYDEDRWPSGAAGGFVTSNPRFRARGLMVYTCFDGLVPSPFGKPAGTKVTAAFLKEQKAIAAFTALVKDGKAENLRRVPTGKDPAPAQGESVIFGVIVTDDPNPWYNGATYLDTLNDEATAKFISVTHDAYAKHLGKDLGGVVPGIFTDEPNHKSPVWNMNPPADAGYAQHLLAWTNKLPAPSGNSRATMSWRASRNSSTKSPAAIRAVSATISTTASPSFSSRASSSKSAIGATSTTASSPATCSPRIRLPRKRKLLVPACAATNTCRHPA